MADKATQLDTATEAVKSMLENLHSVYLTRGSVRDLVEAVLSAAPSAPAPKCDDPDVNDDLYWRLHSLSKSLEGSGRLDVHDNPDAYATVLDAMNWIRASVPACAPTHAARDVLADRKSEIYDWIIQHADDAWRILDSWCMDGDADNDELHEALWAAAKKEVASNAS